jgi:hypothetical protein
MEATLYRTGAVERENPVTKWSFCREGNPVGGSPVENRILLLSGVSVEMATLCGGSPVCKRILLRSGVPVQKETL